MATRSSIAATILQRKNGAKRYRVDADRARKTTPALAETGKRTAEAPITAAIEANATETDSKTAAARRRAAPPIRSQRWVLEAVK
jgi:hypothetical protein